MAPLMHFPYLSLLCDALYRIEAPHFVAWLTAAQDGAVTSCAPILRRSFAGSNIRFVTDECARRGWQIELVVRSDANADT